MIKEIVTVAALALALSVNGQDSTFHSQSTYILPIHGEKNRFIYMGDRWTPDDAIDGRYIWLPVEFEGERFVIKWKDEWSLNER